MRRCCGDFVAVHESGIGPKQTLKNKPPLIASSRKREPRNTASSRRLIGSERAFAINHCGGGPSRGLCFGFILSATRHRWPYVMPARRFPPPWSELLSALPPKRTQIGQLGFIDCLPIATVAWAARATGC